MSTDAAAGPPPLAALLEDLLVDRLGSDDPDGGEPSAADAALLAVLRADLEVAAVAAADRVAAGAPERLPLRLPKGRLTDLQRCERGALARADPGDVAPTEPMLLGQALDRYVQHELACGPVADPVADLMSVLAAQDDAALAEGLLALGDRLPGLLSPLAGAARDWAGIDDGWWPRTQTHAAVHLADGRVLSEGRVDVELGGPLSGRPGVVVEVKSGLPRAEHLGEVLHYALLVALRDGVAPAAVVRWYPGLAPAVMPVGADALATAARRLGDQLLRWAELCAGRPPVEAPGSWCRWCPDADRCPSAARPTGPFDELDEAWEPEEPWEDDDA